MAYENLRVLKSDTDKKVYKYNKIKNEETNNNDNLSIKSPKLLESERLEALKYKSVNAETEILKEIKEKPFHSTAKSLMSAEEFEQAKAFTVSSQQPKNEMVKSNGTEMPDIFSGIADDENEQLQVIKELFTETDIKQKSELLNHEIRGIAKMDFLADNFDIPILRAWVKDFLQLRVSLARKGRAEFIDALKSQNSDDDVGGGAIGKLLKSGRL